MALFIPAVYVLVPAIATVIAVMLAYLSWCRRPAPGATPFAVVFLATGVWSLSYTLELLSTDPAGTLFWGRVAFIGIVAVPTAWLLFALAFTGYEGWRSPVLIGVLLVEPLAVLAAVWTYPATGLVWTDVVPITFEGIVINRYQYGIGFYAAAGYSYVLILLGLGLLVRQLRRVPTARQARGWAIVIGALVPAVGNVLFTAGVRPSPPLNLTHLGFSIGGVFFFWAFYHHGLLDLGSAARERTFESVESPVVLLDTDERIVELNPAAATLLGVPAVVAEGQRLDELLPGDQQVFERTGDRIFTDEVTLTVDGEPRPFRVDVTTIYYPMQQGVMGRVVQLLPGASDLPIDAPGPDGEPSDG